MKKRCCILMLISCMYLASAPAAQAITQIPASNSPDPYASAGEATGNILAALVRKNSTPHINPHREFTYVASASTSSLYMDMGSVKSLRDTAHVKVAKVDTIFVNYANSNILKFSNTLIFDLETKLVQYTPTKVTVFNLSGKLAAGPYEYLENAQTKAIAIHSPMAALANTVYNKLYGTPFYDDSTIPILTQKQKLLD